MKAEGFLMLQKNTTHITMFNMHLSPPTPPPPPPPSPSREHAQGDMGSSKACRLMLQPFDGPGRQSTNKNMKPPCVSLSLSLSVLTRDGACRHGGCHRRLPFTHIGHKFEQNAISRHGKENAGQREHGAQQTGKKTVHC